MSQDAEMSKYIDVDQYNRYEAGHPGYGEMMNVVVHQTIGTFGGTIGKILEIGAGTGEYTRRIAETRTADVDANEIDSGCNAYLQHKIDSGQIPHTRLIAKDFIVWAKQSKSVYDAVNTTFADHHFSPAQKPALLERISALLKSGGAYVLGDEFLPPHTESDPAARVTAQIQYHGMVIEEAFKEGKIELPNLELDALISGLRTTVRFIQQTVPEKREASFLQARGNHDANRDGVAELRQLISRLQAIDHAGLSDNPEQLPADELLRKRRDFITKLEGLADAMSVSRQPGLEEDAVQGKVGGDYKMTVRQYTAYLAQAGFDAVGYFEGPKPVGKCGDPLDGGEGRHAVALKEGQDHAGGVWVIRAQKSRSSSGYENSVSVPAR